MKTRKTTKRKTKRNPTPAQLRARRAFAKRAKERSKAARAKNAESWRKVRMQRLRAARKTATTREEKAAIERGIRGQKLGDVKRKALQKSLKRRPNKTIIKAKRVKIAVANKTRRTRKRNPLTPRDREQLLGINRLIRSLQARISKSKDPMEKQFLRRQMIELRGSQFDLRSKKRNPGRVTPTSRQHREKFTGKPSRKTLSLKAPAGTPKSLAILGRLKTVKGRSFVMPFAKRGRNPNGEIYLAEDDRGNLHIVGDDLPVSSEVLTDFGPIQEIEYITQKPHLGYPETTEFFHHMGEEGGRKPHLVTDSEGAYKIEGGDYFITERGIENPGRRRYRRYR